ncbi:AMIN-like domain-containing (lipo)protein [Rhodococcus sp. NPDC004095]
MTGTRDAALAAVAACLLGVVGCGADTAPRSDNPGWVSPAPVEQSGHLRVGSAPESPPTVVVPTSGPDAADPGPWVSTAAVAEVTVEGNRVVLRFAGDGTLFWKVGYVAEAVPHGGGAPIPVSGRAILQVDIMGTAAAPPPGAPVHDRRNPLPGPPGSVVTELFLLPGRGVGTDAVTQSFIGLSTAPGPFAVTTVEDPPGVVVSVT